MDPCRGVPTAASLLQLPQDVALRGTRLRDILKEGGEALTSSEGGASTYGLSHDVEHIDYFLSHNWCVSGRVKYAALALHFNWLQAAVASLLFAAALTALPASGALPVFSYRTESGVVFERSPYCLIAGPVVFFALLLKWYDIFPAFCSGDGPVLFLDKMCIHQTDADLKRKGIQSLAAFLRRSRTMVVVYSDIYLHKLWTVYELASFQALRADAQVVLLPTQFPTLVLGLSASSTCFWTVFRVLHYDAFENNITKRTATVVNYAILVLMCAPLGIFMRIWNKKLVHMKQVMRTFTIADATCFNEEDRPIVHRNIVQLMKYKNIVPEDACDRVALDTFDGLVREKVPEYLKGSYSGSGIPYQCAVVMVCCQIFDLIDRMLSHVMWRDRTVAGALMTVVAYSVMPLLAWPLCVVVASQLAKTRLHLAGPSELLYVALITVVDAGIYVLIRHCVRKLKSHSKESSACFAGMLAFIAVLALLNLYCYSRKYQPAASSFFTFHVRRWLAPGRRSSDLSDLGGVELARLGP